MSAYKLRGLKSRRSGIHSIAVVPDHSDAGSKRMIFTTSFSPRVGHAVRYLVGLRIRSARNSVNGTMSSRTLAASSARM